MAELQNEGKDKTTKPASEAHIKGHDHTAKIHEEVYKPPVINHGRYGAAANEPLDKSKCSVGPNLNDLTIDVPNVHVKETPNRHDPIATQKETAKHDLPISNEHYREIAKRGAELQHDGIFGVVLKTALDEANQSDKTMGTGGKHVEDLLKYVNAKSCGTENTLAREGDNIKIIRTEFGSSKLDIDTWKLPSQKKKGEEPKPHKPQL